MAGEGKRAEGASGDGSPTPLNSIVEGLKSHPPLLFALGGAIVLAGLVGILSNQAWLLVVAIVLVLVAGLAAWMFGNRPAPPADARRLDGGTVDIGERATVHSDVGSAHGGSVSSTIRAKGALVIGRDAVVGSVVGSAPLAPIAAEEPAPRADPPAPAAPAGSAPDGEPRPPGA